MKNIWDEDEGYYKLKKLTDRMVKKAEGRLKVTLPDSYINLLKVQNGGYLQVNAFPCHVPTSWAEDHVHVNHILGIGKENSILDSSYLIEEWGLPEDVVLFSGDGHSWVAFDYRNTVENPPVIYIDIETEQIIELAPDFETFIDGLYFDKTDIADIAEDNHEFEERTWTLEEVDNAIAGDDEQEIIKALDYIIEHHKENEALLEKKLIVLLQSPILGIKELAANYAYGFYEEGMVSAEGVAEMLPIIKRDKEIAYYAEMFFADFNFENQ